jgi:translation initiation factor RLI1
MDRDVNLLSGGELQRFAIGTVCVQQADVYVIGTLHPILICTNILLVTCSMSLLPIWMSSNV